MSEEQTRKRVLLAEDNILHGGARKTQLERAGYEVEWLTDGRNVQDLLVNKKERFDCIVLDLGLPGVSGMSILERLQEEGVHIPVVIETAYGNDSFQVRGLSKGASDYIIKASSEEPGFNVSGEVITKGVSESVYLARIAKAIELSSDGDTTDVELRYGNLTLNTDTQELNGPDGTRQLARAEYLVLKKLLDNKGRACRTKDLQSGKDEEISSNALQVHVCSLRKDIELVGGEGSMIRTIRGVGYMVAYDKLEDKQNDMEALLGDVQRLSEGGEL